jgi:hypothetical protein
MVINLAVARNSSRFARDTININRMVAAFTQELTAIMFQMAD